MQIFDADFSRKRSKFGKYLDRHNISQIKLVESSGVSKSTISRLCQHDVTPNLQTERKISKAIRTNWNIEFSSEDFW